MDVRRLDYKLPEDSIAQSAIEPRDSSRLLDVRSQTDLVFRDLPNLLNPGDLLVVNSTRVRAARLPGTKPETGGAIEALLVRRVDDDRWEAMLRPARRVRPGLELSFGLISGVVLSDPIDGVVTLRLSVDGGDIESALAEIGQLPLPPYFHGTLDSAERYQTMFADRVGSAAAPTAALHFTPDVVDALTNMSVDIATVELEVGLDTFRPVLVDNLADHRIHTERYSVPDDTVAAILAAKQRSARLVAVGTTVVRTLESAVVDGSVSPGEGVSELFITPGYRFQVVDALLTNFHAPRTTLIALVAAAIGDSWREVYTEAVASGYRFLSFGDSMFIDHVGRPER